MNVPRALVRAGIWVCIRQCVVGASPPRTERGFLVLPAPWDCREMKKSDEKVSITLETCLFYLFKGCLITRENQISPCKCVWVEAGYFK